MKISISECRIPNMLIEFECGFLKRMGWHIVLDIRLRLNVSVIRFNS